MEKLKLNSVNEKTYKFLFKIALIFRLSLDNVCIILGKEVNDENKLEIYNIYKEMFKNNNELKNACAYLFNYETLGETSELSKKSLSLSNMFLNRYRLNIENNNIDGVNKLNSELTKLDDKFKELLDKGNLDILSDEDALTISKYRLKYAISRENICDALNISFNILRAKEEKYTDPVLKYKLNLLSNYYLDILYKNFKGSYK